MLETQDDLGGKIISFHISHRRVIALLAVGVAVRRRRLDPASRSGLGLATTAVGGAGVDGRRLRILLLPLLLLLRLLGLFVLVDVVEVQVVLHISLLRLVNRV